MNRRSQRSWKAAWLTLVLIGFAVAAAVIFGVRPESTVETVEAIDGFLAQHWRDPLPAQGDPPAAFSALEASLEPQACGQCHVQQYADWGTSLHSRAMGPGIRWQLRVMNQEQGNRCLRCHAPLAEQKALTALELGWGNAPSSPAPPYVGTGLHRKGVVCAACHVRRHERFGPLPAGAAADASGAPVTPLPHGGFVVAEAFSDSRFCSTCHQFPADGNSLNGKLLENTLEEWRASPAARAGRNCQSCHMPQRRHLWRGIHDRHAVEEAIGRRLHVVRDGVGHATATIEVSAHGVGHHFPTYVVPKVHLILSLVGVSAGSARELWRHVIGRTADVDLTQELADTRLPGGATARFTVTFALGVGDREVVLDVEVAPAEHYERMYAAMAERMTLDGKALALLAQARAEARATRYRLDRVRVPLPANAGVSAQAVAN